MVAEKGYRQTRCSQKLGGRKDFSEEQYLWRGFV
jgi:hypothetical protein